MENQTEEQLELTRKKLLEQLERPTIEPLLYTHHAINWIDEASDWKQTKEINLEAMNRHVNLIFLSHAKDTIKGKPQLVHQTIQRIPLVKKIEKTIKKTDENTNKIYYDTLIQYKFIDDRFDKRYDGNEVENIAFDFWVYKVVDNGKEFYLFSEKKLPNEYCEFSGMKINLDDLSDLTNSLKVKKIASIFICKEAKPYVKIIKKDKLIDFIKSTPLNAESFTDFVFCRPDMKVYKYTDDFNLLRIAQLLSGKFEGYPLHLIKFGPVGTGKTFEAEALDFKFQEEQGILEAANSTLKVLVPSFKEKPANLGYICNCNRAAIVDEMMKMVEKAMMDGHDSKNFVSNYFGQLNMLLEQKDRMVKIFFISAFFCNA